MFRITHRQTHETRCRQTFRKYMEENKFRRRGHRAIMSPIAHPELAGNGIENTRGAFQRCTTGERTNKTDLRRVCPPASNGFLCVVESRLAQTAGTIVSMDWNKRISSLDERETTLEYIEESTLLRVLSILSAFERRRRVITVLSTERRLRFVRLHGSV